MKVILTIHCQTHILYSDVVGVFDELEVESIVFDLFRLDKYKGAARYWTTKEIDPNGYVGNTVVHFADMQKTYANKYWPV